MVIILTGLSLEPVLRLRRRNGGSVSTSSTTSSGRRILRAERSEDMLLVRTQSKRATPSESPNNNFHGLSIAPAAIGSNPSGHFVP